MSMNYCTALELATFLKNAAETIDTLEATRIRIAQELEALTDEQPVSNYFHVTINYMRRGTGRSASGDTEETTEDVELEVPMNRQTLLSHLKTMQEQQSALIIQQLEACERAVKGAT